MPLVPPVLPSDVESVGALTYTIFDLADQPTLDTFIQGCIDFADAWMQGHMSGSYGLTQFTWQVELQRRGQVYLALEAAIDTLKAKKTWGSHVNYISEDTAAYRDLIENDWGQKAMQALDLWVTVEQINRNFAMPLFEVGQAIPETDSTCNGLEPLNALYAGLLDRARGFGDPDLQTVSR